MLSPDWWLPEVFSHGDVLTAQGHPVPCPLALMPISPAEALKYENPPRIQTNPATQQLFTSLPRFCSFCFTADWLAFFAGPLLQLHFIPSS